MPPNVQPYEAEPTCQYDPDALRSCRAGSDVVPIYPGDENDHLLANQADMLQSSLPPKGQDHSASHPIPRLNLPDFSRPASAAPTATHALELPDFSTQASSAPTVPALREHLLALLRILGRVTHSRCETNQLRTEIAYLLKVSQHRSNHLLESHHLYRLSSQQPDVPETERISTQLSDDHAAFDGIMDRIRTREEDLNRKDFHTRKYEEDLTVATHELITMLGRLNFLDLSELDHLPTASEIGVESVTPRPATPTYPAVLAEYFDKKGDLSIMKERLADLWMEYQDDLLQRDLREDQGWPQEVSREAFDAQHRHQREQALQRIEDAMVAVSAAHETCVRAGIDPSQYTQHVAHPEVLESDVISSYSGPLDNPGVSLRAPTTQSWTSHLRHSGNGALLEPGSAITQIERPTRCREQSLDATIQHWMDINRATIMSSLPDPQLAIDALDTSFPRPTVIRRWRSYPTLEDSRPGSCRFADHQDVAGSKQYFRLQTVQGSDYPWILTAANQRRSCSI